MLHQIEVEVHLGLIIWCALLHASDLLSHDSFEVFALTGVSSVQVIDQLLQCLNRRIKIDDRIVSRLNERSHIKKGGADGFHFLENVKSDDNPAKEKPLK